MMKIFFFTVCFFYSRIVLKLIAFVIYVSIILMLIRVQFPKVSVTDGNKTSHASRPLLLSVRLSHKAWKN